MSPAPPPQVLAYDYSGYGASSGAPSEANCYADIQAAHDYLRSRGVDSSSLLLYGQSVGSAPSLWLAARCAVAGVVLHTPLMSVTNAISGLTVVGGMLIIGQGGGFLGQVSAMRSR